MLVLVLLLLLLSLLLLLLLLAILVSFEVGTYPCSSKARYALSGRVYGTMVDDPGTVLIIEGIHCCF